MSEQQVVLAPRFWSVSGCTCIGASSDGEWADWLHGDGINIADTCEDTFTEFIFSSILHGVLIRFS